MSTNTTKDPDKILEDAKKWFKTTIAENHKINTEKLKNSKEFNINPFLAVYLANFLTGDASPKSVAKALIYPRVLGTSITTSFGTNIQKFTSEVLGTFGSAISGIDIEFEDKIDGIHKYCQMKAGPVTINKDDVITIKNHFNSVIRLSKTNSLNLGFNSLVVGVIYGEPKDLSAHYNDITKTHHYSVLIGKDFWHRLTGEADFYEKLIQAIGSVAIEYDYCKELNNVIDSLANDPDIKSISIEPEE